MRACGNVVSLHGPRAEPEGAGGVAPEVLAAWTVWLEDRLDPGWRPGEWDAAAWLFSGEVDNPGTVIFRCATAACESMCRARGLCTGCERALRASGLEAREFKATFVPERNRVITGERARCQVVDCPRESVLWGLCNAHSSARQHDLRRNPGSELDIWVAQQVPYPPVAACSVPGCRYDSRAVLGLCGMHASRWKKHVAAQRGRRSAEVVDAGWLDRQAPYLNIHQFSLAPLVPVARLEVLYALQQRDERGQKIDPVAVRQAVTHLADAVESVATAPAESLPGRMQANVDALVRETHRILTGAFERFQGHDPADKPVLDLSELGVRGVRGKPTHRPGGLDLTDLRQPWLRQVLVTWITETKPTTAEVRRATRACRAAARALDARPGGGMDPAALGFADMTAVVDTFRVLPKLDGSPMGNKQRSALLSCFFKVLDYNRAAGHLDKMSAGFARHSSHSIARGEVEEDEAGKALPETVIAQLDDHMHLLGAGISHGRMSAEQVAAMARTVYELLRDTGRRPYEIAELRLNCLKYEAGDWSLVWDNRKGRRNRRHLPLTAETAEVVKRWRGVRELLDLPTGSEPYLFPPAGENGMVRHLGSDHIWNIVRTFADRQDMVVLSEEFGRDGERVAFDRSLIFPYAFRHSYAQRHADAGVPIDVLRELMDHTSIQTTQGYYKVSQKRKRQAVNVMRMHTVDRSGRSAPMASATAYQARSVQVPFGNCTEPANVKAGGKACPIRFQCAACPSYRPDPSYLPAIEDHVLSLKADKEMAVMMEADEFVVRNLDDQIGAFKGVADTMRTLMESMGADQRSEVEEAAAVLRKVRAAGGGGSVALPMPTFPGPRDGDTA